jgi:Flp pilus assembly pilin Flp
MWNELNRLMLSLYTRVQIQKEEGQTLVEYTLIIALVSIAAIAGLGALGAAITGKLGIVVTELEAAA